MLAFALLPLALAAPLTPVTPITPERAGVMLLDVVDDESGARDLTGQWLFHLGDDPAFAAAAFDDTTWEALEAPRGIGAQGHARDVGVFWYRLHLRLPATTAATQQLALQMGMVDGAYQLFVDGAQLGEVGHVDAPVVDAHDELRLWSVPPHAADDGEIVIAVRGVRTDLRASSNPSRGGIWRGPLALGTTATMARAAWLRDLDNIIAAAVIVVIGLYHLQLFRRRREQRGYLWFGVFCLAIGGYLRMETDATHVFGTVVRMKLVFGCEILAVPIFMQFLWPLLGEKIKTHWRALQLAIVAYWFVVLASPTTWFVDITLPWFELFLLLPALLGTLWLIVTKAWRGDQEARTLLLGTLALVVASAVNALHDRILLVNLPSLMSYATIVYVLSMAFSLSNRFARVFRDLDEKNTSLVRMDRATRRFVPSDFLSLLNRSSLLEVDKGDNVQKEMSILFSDLRSFTTIVEKKGPEESFRFINEYLSFMEPAIVESGGFVDSFIGDAIMALFAGRSSSTSARDAIRAGIVMHKSGLAAFNEMRAKAGEAPVAIGIGVNTGPLTLGTIGGRDHLKCGVIGDSVNLASRIEGMTKMYGARFLVSDATRIAAGAGAFFREVDRVQAKGKAQPVTIYEVLDADEDSVRDAKHASLSRYAEALALYRARSFVEAHALFSELANASPADILFALYRSRAADMTRAPPADDWDGVVRLTTK